MILRPKQALAALIFASVLPAGAQTQRQFWPEVKVFVSVNEAVRFISKASMNRDRDTSYREGTFGYFLDVAMKPVFRRKLREREDVFRRRFLTFRGGVQYTTGLASGDARREKRGLIEFTGRYPLPAQFVATDRNRGEFRFIRGQAFSARYRNRLQLERDEKIGRFIITPYGYAEVFYDTRYNAWVQNRFAAGVEIPAGPHAVIKPYFVRQTNRRSDPPHVNAVGLMFNLYF
jgi:hypothetical protein